MANRYVPLFLVKDRAFFDAIQPLIVQSVNCLITTDIKAVG